MRVKAYRNLHKKCFSIVDLKTGRVFKHQFHVVLRNASFRVSESGRQRVLREKRKNVHAYVVGELVETNFQFPDLQPKEAYYNPYKVDSFRIWDETKRGPSDEKIEKASLVLLAPGSTYVWE